MRSRLCPGSKLPKGVSEERLATANPDHFSAFFLYPIQDILGRLLRIILTGTSGLWTDSRVVSLLASSLHLYDGRSF